VPPELARQQIGDALLELDEFPLHVCTPKRIAVGACSISIKS
jgi:hypothetical protein